MTKSMKITRVIFITIIVVVLAVWYMFTAPKRFAQSVKAGMSQNQVRGLLGSPTYTNVPGNGNGAVGWGYHRWWMGDAIVFFDTNRSVTFVDIEQ